MNNKIKYILVLLQFVIGSNWAQSQTVSIPDTNFRKFLSNKFPSYFDVNERLIIDSAKTYTGSIDCSNKSISDISGIEYFENLTKLNCSSNNIIKFPDIKNLNQLTQLNIQDNTLTSLVQFKGLLSLEIFDCSKNKLTSIPELSSLINLEEFYCSYNNIESLPAIDSLKNLSFFIVDHNQLKSLPDFSNNVNLMKIHCHVNKLDSIGSLKNLKQLISLRFSHNNIKQMPDISNNTKLRTIHGADNLLTSIPDLSGYKDLDNVQLYNNNLSFASILPLRAHPLFSTFQFQPQNPFGISKDTSVTKGGIINLKFKINEVDSSVYSWYRNNVLIGTTTTPEFKISKVDESSNGAYTCVITTAATQLSGMSLSARLGNVNITPCITFSNINYQIISNDCSKGASVEIDDSQVVAPFGPLKYVLTCAGNKTIETSNKKVDALVPCRYSLTISDTNNCSVSLQNYIYIPNSTSCVASFTPNGDGIEDVFFIEQAGVAKIYDKNGLLVKTLNTPQAWDGCSDGGAQLDMGYYVIVINAKDKIGVVLVD